MTTPCKILILGASYGAGGYGMAGRAYDPRFLFTWPASKTAVMGPEQLAGVMSLLGRTSAEKAGRPFDEAADRAMRQAVERQIEAESLPASGSVMAMEAHLPLKRASAYAAGIETSTVSTIAATGLFVFIGFKPNTGVIDGHYVHDAGGYVITDLAMQSSISGLFVAGDMRAQLTRQVTTAQGDATTAAIAADRYIKALKTGHPDPAAAVLGDIGVPRPRAPEGAAAAGGAEAYGVAVGTGEATAR